MLLQCCCCECCCLCTVTHTRTGMGAVAQKQLHSIQNALDLKRLPINWVRHFQPTFLPRSFRMEKPTKLLLLSSATGKTHTFSRFMVICAGTPIQETNARINYKRYKHKRIKVHPMYPVKQCSVTCIPVHLCFV